MNSAHAALAACEAGLGLAMLPSFVGDAPLARGTVVNALPGWTGPELGLFAIVLERRWVSAAVRALVEHVRGGLAGRREGAPSALPSPL